MPFLKLWRRKTGAEIKKIVVMGCLSERFKNELAAEIPEVDSFFGTNQLHDVLNSLGADYKTNLLGERLLTTPSHYAYLKNLRRMRQSLFFLRHSTHAGKTSQQADGRTCTRNTTACRKRSKGTHCHCAGYDILWIGFV